MLAKLSTVLPPAGDYIYEPKWDGFRTLVFRDAKHVVLQSRDEKPFNRYFPEILEPLASSLPERCVLDGEIVIAGPRGLDFDALLLRIHPAASRVAKLAAEHPCSYVAFDLLALGDEDLRGRPQRERRAKLAEALAGAKPPVFLTPATTDRELAADWFSRFEGAGLDGVIAKPPGEIYLPGKRAMLKVKHAREADCVVAGFRWHKNGPGSEVGSLLLGLYDDQGTLHSVGVASSFSAVRRKELLEELQPLRENALESHPWREWAEIDPEELQRMPGATSRWNRGKDLSWQPVRIARVVQVHYDHLQGGRRFRHATQFERWRPDKQPRDCTYAQLEETAPYELAQIFKT
jgi:ATP-dependent DNA ligase